MNAKGMRLLPNQRSPRPDGGNAGFTLKDFRLDRSDLNLLVLLTFEMMPCSSVCTRMLLHQKVPQPRPQQTRLRPNRFTEYWQDREATPPSATLNPQTGENCAPAAQTHGRWKYSLCIYHQALHIYLLPIYIQAVHTLPFKSLGSLRNVFIFQRKALFFK